VVSRCVLPPAYVRSHWEKHMIVVCG
jgi:hypothetical protein